MKLFFKNNNGNSIVTDKIYIDIMENVSDIRIIKIDNELYARPDGLDPELLSEVCMNLKPCM